MEKIPVSCTINKDRNSFYLTVDLSHGVQRILLYESMKSLWSKHEILINKSIFILKDDGVTYIVKTSAKEFTITFQEKAQAELLYKNYVSRSTITQDKNTITSLEGQMKGTWPFPAFECY